MEPLLSTIQRDKRANREKKWEGSGSNYWLSQGPAVGAPEWIGATVSERDLREVIRDENNEDQRHEPRRAGRGWRPSCRDAAVREGARLSVQQRPRAVFGERTRVGSGRRAVLRAGRAPGRDVPRQPQPSRARVGRRACVLNTSCGSEHSGKPVPFSLKNGKRVSDNQGRAGARPSPPEFQGGAINRS